MSLRAAAPSLALLLVCAVGTNGGRPADRDRRLVAHPHGGSADKSGVVCSQEDAVYIIQQNAGLLTDKFARAMDDLEIMLQTILAENSRDGVRSLVLSADMCCCNTADWRELGRSSAWAGYHDCNPNRTNELWYGNVSLDGGHGMFVGSRTIDTDLAFVGAAYDVFPWIVERQLKSFDQDGFYAAAWIGTTGEVWSYYPGFNLMWPGHYFGDYIGGDYSGRGDLFVKVTLPENNPTRLRIWTPPYPDPAGQGLVISATIPVYFSGSFRGHSFQDEYIAAMGIDILLNHMEPLMSALRPTPSSLPMIIDDEGRLISAPPVTVAAIFGAGVTLNETIECPGQDTGVSMRRSACPISLSSTGDWGALVLAVRNASRGTREIYKFMQVTKDGLSVSHLAVFYRWQGRDAPLWNSVVVIPQNELNRMGQWNLPPSISVSLSDAQGTAYATFSFLNTGVVNLTYRIIRLPVWLSVVAPVGSGAGLDGPAPLGAGAAVEYVVRIDGSKSSGSQTASISWLVEDDNYPDCFVEAEASVEVSLWVPVQSEKWLPAFVISLSSVVGCLLASLCTRFLYKWRKKMARLNKERQQHEEEQLVIAEKVMRSMAFPIHLLLASEFCRLERLLQYEILRDDCRLKVYDLIEDVAATKYFFLSHQWTAWHHPDYNICQFPLMRTSVLELATRLHWELDKSCVWVDYCSIPQRHSEMQKLAILSLPLYAAYATVFVIVAPEVEHFNTREPCDLESYMTRTWCRAEQMSHVVSRGFRHMYCASSKEGVAPVDRLMVKTALHVFEGSLTCCRIRHKGMSKCDKEHLVLPLLGLYANMLRVQAADSFGTMCGHDSIREFVATEGDIEKEMFPKKFRFESDKGVEERQLFGDLVEKIKEKVRCTQDANFFSHFDTDSHSQDELPAASDCERDLEQTN